MGYSSALIARPFIAASVFISASSGEFEFRDFEIVYNFGYFSSFYFFFIFFFRDLCSSFEFDL